MNVIVGKKIGLAALILAPLLTTACALTRAAEDEAISPLAPTIQELVDANRRYPRWEDFPATPVGVPTSQAISTQVASLQGESTALAQQTAAIDWTLEDPGGFAQAVRSRVEASRPSASTVQTQADVEAFAQRLRARAVAPPPIDRFSRPPG